MFIVVLFTVRQTWKQPRHPSTSKWERKCAVYTQRNIIQPEKKKEILTFAETCTALGGIYLNEVS